MYFIFPISSFRLSSVFGMPELCILDYLQAPLFGETYEPCCQRGITRLRKRNMASAVAGEFRPGEPCIFMTAEEICRSKQRSNFGNSGDEWSSNPPFRCSTGCVLFCCLISCLRWCFYSAWEEKTLILCKNSPELHFGIRNCPGCFKGLDSHWASGKAR